MTGVRGRTGDLTERGLRDGYADQAAWLNVGMERHEVQLYASGEDELTVRHDVTKADGSFTSRSEHFTMGQKRRARAAFDRERRH